MPDLDRLTASAALIRHRGPDSVGVHREAGIGLVHTRLSLVDLNERSNQPFWDPSQRFCLIYNGEIYNFKALREDLEGRQVKFTTTSDTEVLLHCLIVYGVELTLQKLEGMFAFAFYDKQERTLVAARDRFGIKPLAVYEDEQLLLFASEVKAMRLWTELKPNAFVITSYLLGSDGPEKGASFYQGVTLLPPGSLLRVRVGEKARIERYASLADMLDADYAEELAGMNANQVIDLVDETLQSAVRQMMFADASVGALCSGGVDSSVLMAMAARDHKNLAIFHADVTGPGSEYGAALALSRHLKLDLKKVDVHDEDFIELLPDVMAHYEYPFARHYHSVPFLMVAHLVREHGVKGVLTGEGADECFLGYYRMARQPMKQRMQKLASLIHRIPRIGAVLAPRDSATPRLIADMLGGFEKSLEEQEFRKAYVEAMGRPADNNVSTLDLLAYHLRTLLHRNDTMGMAASIEARFPFLSERLVKTAINLPYQRKIAFSATVWDKEHPLLRDKWVLRKVADRYLPKELSQRKKWPFTVTAYLRMKIPYEYFERSFVADFFGLSGPELRYLIENAEQRLKVKLLMLDVWAQICLDNLDRESVRRKLRTHVALAA